MSQTFNPLVVAATDTPPERDRSPSGTGLCAGTTIRTMRGDVPVDELFLGDEVVTVGGEQHPVRSLGSLAFETTDHPDPHAVWPVLIRAEAFGEQLPAKDLWVGPRQGVEFDGVLIPACRLVNSATIEQVARPRLKYWHVALDGPNRLLAEGLPVESSLGETRADPSPPELTAAKSALLARALQLGFALTDDTDVHVTADGQRIDPIVLRPGRIAFTIPPDRRSIALQCRTFIPAHTVAESRDERELGVCVGRLQLNGVDVPWDHPTVFTQGWHLLECDASGHPQRWSQGHTPLPEGTRLVLIDITSRSYCWEPRSGKVVNLFSMRGRSDPDS